MLPSTIFVQEFLENFRSREICLYSSSKGCLQRLYFYVASGELILFRLTLDKSCLPSIVAVKHYYFYRPQMKKYRKARTDKTTIADVSLIFPRSCAFSKTVPEITLQIRRFFYLTVNLH